MSTLDPCIVAASSASFDAVRCENLESHLTESGAAGEIAFVWPGNDIRLTIDPNCNAAAEERLAACKSALSSGLHSVQSTTLNLLQQWMQEASPRYGGWLGLRKRDGQCVEKLYVEIPGDAPWSLWERSWSGSEAILGKRDAKPVMVGLDPLRPGIEIYQHLTGLCRRGLTLLLRRFGFEACERDVIEVIERLTGRTFRRELQSDDLGFSVALWEPAKSEILTIYSVSEALLGPASRARSALLNLGESRNWPMDDYALLSGPDQNGQYPHHGLIGIVLAHNRPPAVTTTLAVDMRSIS